MFKAVIKAETLKSVIYIVSTIVDEAKLVISPEEVRIRAIDPAHVAMLDITIGSSAFNAYEADNADIGLDLDKFKSVLKLADSSDDIYLEHDPDQGRLTIRIGSITRRMSLVDTTTMVDPRVPNMDIPNRICIAADVLKKGIKASENVSDHIAISATPEYFELSCEGDTDFASLRVAAGDCIAMETEGSIRSMYPLDYFSNIVKVIPAKTEVDVRFNDDFPIKLLFSLADKMIDVVYFLAPRIENE